MEIVEERYLLQYNTNTERYGWETFNSRDTKEYAIKDAIAIESEEQLEIRIVHEVVTHEVITDFVSSKRQ